MFKRKMVSAGTAAPRHLSYMEFNHEQFSYPQETAKKTEIIELGKDTELKHYPLQIVLQRKILQECAQSLIATQDKIEIVDFGCGGYEGGKLTLFFSEIRKDFPQEKFIHTTGYEPDDRLKIDLADLEEKFSSPFLNYVDKLPAQADAVLCHFSAHHFDDLHNIIEGMVASLKPKYIIIAEFDFTKVDQKEFAKTFGSTDLGRQEIKKFSKKNKGQGLKSCYEFHQKFSLKDYQEVLKEWHYKIEKIYQGNPEHLQDRHRFIIVARQEELKGCNLDKKEVKIYP